MKTQLAMPGILPQMARHLPGGRASTPAAAVTGGGSAASVELARVRTVWWYGLGVLWVIDALLQAQPGMFSANGLAENVVLPAIAGQPGWIAGPMSWGIQVWDRAPALWNASAVALELVIGGLVLSGPRRAAWGRIGLLLSIGWGMAIWFLGEGLGGLFAGTPSYLAGAPGSVVLYVLLAGALLLPEVAWSSARTLAGLRAGAALLWGIGTVLQVAPFFWSPMGLASVVQNAAMMPLPLGLSALDAQLVAAMASAPVLWNAALAAVMLGMAAIPFIGRGGRAPYIVALVWLLFVWLVFQGLGMVFSAMATDLNTPPLWALLLAPGWVAASGRARSRTARARDRQALKA